MWIGNTVPGEALDPVMSHQPNHIYEFGPFRLDASEHLLLRDDVVMPLQPKAFNLLCALVERHGRLLEKGNLIQVRLARFFAWGFSPNSRRTSWSGVAPSRRYCARNASMRAMKRGSVSKR